MKPVIVLLACGVLAACVSPEQRAAEERRQAELANAIIQACERSGYPRGTAENIQCATRLVDQVYGSGGDLSGAEAAYRAYSRGFEAGDRVRSGIPEQNRVIIAP